MTTVERAPVTAAPLGSGHMGSAGRNGRQILRRGRVGHFVLWIAASTALLIGLGVLDQALTVAKV
jgi:hypothetical protein